MRKYVVFTEPMLMLEARNRLFFFPVAATPVTHTNEELIKYYCRNAKGSIRVFDSKEAADTFAFMHRPDHTIHAFEPLNPISQPPVFEVQLADSAILSEKIEEKARSAYSHSDWDMDPNIEKEDMGLSSSGMRYKNYFYPTHRCVAADQVVALVGAFDIHLEYWLQHSLISNASQPAVSC